jgi:hypothetical protein
MPLRLERIFFPENSNHAASDAGHKGQVPTQSMNKKDEALKEAVEESNNCLSRNLPSSPPHTPVNGLPTERAKEKL